MPQGPLVGVRVVELAGLGPAPFACMVLAELGADVIKIDRPGAEGFGLPPAYDLLSRGRPAIRIDLARPRGIEVVLRLVDSADVFVEGYRPGVCERLGLGPGPLLERRPALVYGRMTGWGQDGPLAATAGHDIDYIAVTGALAAIGSAERSAVPLNLLGDFGGGGMYLVVGVLAALWEAARSGMGQVVDAAVVDGVAHLSTAIWGMLGAGRWNERREANLLDGGAPFYCVYQTSDGGQLAVGPLEARFYADFVRLLGLTEAVPDRTDQQRWGELRDMIARRIASKSQAEWVAIFAGSDACVAPVLAWRQAAEHAQLAARGVVIEHEGVMQPAPAPRFSRTPTTVATAPSTDRRERSEQALRSWGVTDAAELVAAGVVVPTGMP